MSEKPRYPFADKYYLLGAWLMKQKRQGKSEANIVIPIEFAEWVGGWIQQAYEDGIDDGRATRDD